MSKRKAAPAKTTRQDMDAEQLEQQKDLSVWERTALGQLAPAEVPSAERKRWHALAIENTAFNHAVMRAVWKGEKSQLAARYEDEGGGGELKRVGWPDGYRPKLDPSYSLRQFMKTRRVSKLAVRAVATQSVTMPTGDLAGKRITVLAKSNPKKPGTAAHARFELYRTGMTVAECVEKGASLGALRWNVEHGYLALS